MTLLEAINSGQPARFDSRITPKLPARRHTFSITCETDCPQCNRVWEDR